MHVVATAGHVDHGKSTLVRALTGMEPDRLAEEVRRGLTIDLGYAWTALPTGETVAFVDVPGHQRFISNMLAGAGPAPAVMFVVAADAGWSRQSGEHLAALDALGVRHGLLVIARSDLADPLAAQQQSRSQLAGTSLSAMDSVAVSALTGDGLDELRAALHRMLAAAPAPEHTDRVRLWIDRSFTVRGAGTVLTGTLEAGRIAVGDRLLLASTGAPVRVRGLESLGESCDEVQAVARVALNVSGASPADTARGDSLLRAGQWRCADEIDVRLTGRTPPADLPVQLLLHIGAASVAVRVRLLGPDTARLTLQRQLPLQNGDRLALRDPGQQSIAAGAVVLDADPPLLRRRGAALARAKVLAAVGDPDAVGEISRRGMLRRRQLIELGCGLPKPSPQVRCVGEWFVAADVWADLALALESAIDNEHRLRPMSAGLSVDAALHAVGVPDRALVSALVRDIAGVELENGLLTRRGHTFEVPAAIVALLEILRRTPYDAPTATWLAAAGVTASALAASERAGLLRRLTDDVVLLPAAIDAAVVTLRALPQPFTLAEARDALATSRRVALALLEHLDSVGTTSRDAERRRTIG